MDVIYIYDIFVCVITWLESIERKRNHISSSRSSAESSITCSLIWSREPVCRSYHLRLTLSCWAPFIYCTPGCTCNTNMVLYITPPPPLKFSKKKDYLVQWCIRGLRIYSIVITNRIWSSLKYIHNPPPPPPRFSTPPFFQIIKSICTTPNFKSWMHPCRYLAADVSNLHSIK